MDEDAQTHPAPSRSGARLRDRQDFANKNSVRVNTPAADRATSLAAGTSPRRGRATPPTQAARPRENPPSEFELRRRARVRSGFKHLSSQPQAQGKRVSAMKVLKLGVSVAAIALAVAVGGGLLAPALFAPRQEVAVNAADPVLIEQGRAVAQASDCVACHTAADGKLFAGGLAMRTPLGVITSTNITPDKRDGIGGYDYADFERAVRHGVRKDGAPLYPAMPYVSFAVLTDADTQALYAYFMSAVAPVAQPNQPPAIPWPQNMRWPLAWWQMLFASPRDFTAAPGAAPEVARGAYLVEGPGHCGACHTPRGAALQEVALKDGPGGEFLSGSELEGWYAKNLRQETGGWPAGPARRSRIS